MVGLFLSPFEKKRSGRVEEARTSTAASNAGAVKSSNQKLTITRKESEGDDAMVDLNLREVQTP